ncbi:MAG: hypothetical protein H5T59_11410, partial [Anaerolineae bacterium]|nr:hypothetical protein [Anaerolineae bacterium]
MALTRHDPEQLEALAAQARAGDPDALAALWDLVLPVTCARARRALQRLQWGEVPFYDADDLLQDLFLEFHRWLREEPRGRGPYDLLQRWSYRLPSVLRGLLRRPPLRLGAEKREQAWEDDGAEEGWPAPGPGPLQEALRGEQRARVRAALARLAPEERDLLWRRYAWEEPVSDLARALGRKPGEV